MAATWSSEVNTASPIAVLSASDRVWSRAMTAAWSVVGSARTAVVPEKVTTPTLKVSGSPSTNVAAAARAASSRFGATSVASIERETSIATMTVARSWGTRMSISGRAVATARVTRARTKAAAGACRRHPGRSGATESSIGREAKRTAYRCRRRWART